jgi:hypothetical protein
LISEITANLKNIVLVLATRPMNPVPMYIQQLPFLENVTIIELDKLPDADCEKFVCGNEFYIVTIK